MFVTLFMGFYDISTGRVRYINAGHPIPRLIGPRGVRPFGQETGALVGVIEGETWTDAQETLALHESLVLYTDGITEAGMGDRDLYGETRMDELLRRCAGKPAEEVSRILAEDVARYQQDHLTDDVTVLVLRRTM
jgi:serine phosphatase RsbU (regulator of sigma subunit)